MLGNGSPRLAGPRSWLGWIFRRVAIMPRTEALAPFRVRFLDGHVGITESHLDDRSLRVLHINRTLLLLTRSVEGLVQSDCLALVFSHIKPVLPRTMAKPEYPSSFPVSWASGTESSEQHPLRVPP